MTILNQNFIKALLKKQFYIQKIAVFFCAALVSMHTFAQQTDAIINQLYRHLNSQLKGNIPARIDAISAQFAGKPYELTALGEGANAHFDQAPLYRMDAFDCETYVDTILALALGHDLETFKHYIQHIRYRDGKISYITRNHFTCLDWNQNNQKQGFIKDITLTIHNDKNQPVAQYAKALIDKPSWYQHFTTKKIRVPHLTPNEQEERLTLLKEKGSRLPKVTVTIPYISLDTLFNASDEPNQALFKQIPHGAIIEIVRPNWDLTKEIGTHLNVSHLGFAIWKNGTLLFRETSSIDGRAVDVSMIDYLKHAKQNSPTIKGINIQAVIES